MVKDLESNLSEGGPIAPSTLGAMVSFADDAIEVVVTRLDVGLEAVRAATALLSDAERQRASRLVFDRDRRRFTVARARLRQLLAARLGVRPESVELAYSIRGKPTLARRFADSDLRFNLSHSDDVAVYALSRGREIGIDVEAVRVIPDADDIAARFFSHRENEV
jgi:4'-phosphopantetheinyl transferase